MAPSPEQPETGPVQNPGVTESIQEIVRPLDGEHDTEPGDQADDDHSQADQQPHHGFAPAELCVVADRPDR